MMMSLSRGTPEKQKSRRVFQPSGLDFRRFFFYVGLLSGRWLGRLFMNVAANTG